MTRRAFNAFNDTPRGKHWLVDGPRTTSPSRMTQINTKMNSKSNRDVNGDIQPFSSQVDISDESTLRGKPSREKKQHGDRSVFSLLGNNKNSTTNTTLPSHATSPASSFNDELDQNNDINVDNKAHLYKEKEKRCEDSIENLPLISPTILDVSKQRLLMMTLFTILQSYKIYDLIVLKLNSRTTVSTFTFCLKYFILDSLFLFILPNFNIPRLNFGPFVTLCQIFVINGITLYLSINQNNHFLIFMYIITSIWNKIYHSKVLTLNGSPLANNHVLIDSSTHFKGALTVKILPENTAFLNPFHDSFCLPIDSSSYYPATSDLNFINVPIKINSTEPIDFVQLEFKDFYTNQSSLKNFTSKDFTIVNKDRLPPHWEKYDNNIHDNTIRYLNLGLNDIGFYRIEKIVDTKGLNLKIYQSHLILPHCPMASITSFQTDDIAANNKCIGDKDHVSIEVHGIPPLKLFYSKTINDQTWEFNDKNLQPEYFESPLQSYTDPSRGGKKINTVFNTMDVEDLKWARSYPVNITLNSVTTRDGIYTYKIDKVVDALGNVIDYSKTIDDDSIKIKYDLMSTFIVHNSPKASLDSTFNPSSQTKKNIVINLETINNWEGDLPFKLNYSFIDPITRQAKHNIIELNTLSHQIVADSAGIYQLNSIDSKYCSGSIVGKSNILITKPIPPHLDVKSSTINDPCLGPVGLDFDLTFTGIPPFHYMVKIFKIDKTHTNNSRRKLYDTKRLTSKGARNQFKYIPSVEGQYEIIFDNLSNDLFTDPIALTPLENYNFKTSMRVKPSAMIKPRNNLKNLCLGDSTMIPIQFKGEPPFTLQYDIIETSSNKRKSYTESKIMANDFLIKTPDFTMGGDYILSLVSIKDSSKCLVSLSEPDARITVRRDIPSASFNFIENANDVQIKQGGIAEIPIRLTGESPFTLKYEHFDLEGNSLGIYETKFQSNYKQSLSVFKEGIYKLKEMHDSSCNGQIENIDSQFKVTYLLRPSFTIQENPNNKISKLTGSVFSKDAVCQNYETSVDLSLAGSPPFILTYELTSPHGQTWIKTMQITTKYASLQLPNRESGEYVAIIKSIYDANYDEADFKHIDTSNDEIIVKQQVNPIPQIIFGDKGKTLRTCSINVDQQVERKGSFSGNTFLEPIKLKHIRGIGPFTITFNIYHESTSRTDHITLDNVDINDFPYYRLYEGLKLGKHVITMERIVDTNGCVNDFANNHDNFIFVTITDVPKIHLLDATDEYCVGDYVTYQLNGVPPFNIRYDFNGVELQSQERSSQFVRVASEPGTIAINSIQDSISQCIVNFTLPSMEQERKKLSLAIHPIPSVTVSQGNYIVEDIHEGDQAEVVFSFEGTPPFSVTYVRTEDSVHNRERRPQVVETHKVTDIYDYEYRVQTSLQGTYEAIEISDAFCFAKNDAFFNN